MQPYYQDDSCTLFHGDCREALPAMRADASIVTDPPWGIAYKSGHNSSRKGFGATLVRTDGNFAGIAGDDSPFDPAPLLRFARVVIWGGHHFYDRLPAGGTWLIWDKLAGKAPFPSGSDCELAWCNWKGPTRLCTHLWRGIMRAGEENVVNEPKWHPNQKPLALMRWTLQECGGDLIIDPYAGSGSTLRAAKDLGIKSIGWELEERYCEVIARRLEQGVLDFTEEKQCV